MFYNKEHNQYVTEGTAFTLGDVQYPANWLNMSTPEEKTALGLVEVVVVGSPKDDKYYWVSTTLEDGVLTYINTAKEFQPCVEFAVEQINTTAYSLLSPSDWMVTKSIETSTPVDSAWTAYRASVRATANAAKDAIANTANVDELAALTVTWPNDPNYVEPVVEVTEPVEPTDNGAV